MHNVLSEFFASPSRRLLVIAGPCILEDQATNERIGTEVRDACARLGLPFVFKASFDKANRSSIKGHRGPGLERGLAELARMRERLGAPVTTDIHDPSQAAPAAAQGRPLHTTWSPSPPFLDVCRGKKRHWTTDKAATASTPGEISHPASNIGEQLAAEPFVNPSRRSAGWTSRS